MLLVDGTKTAPVPGEEVGLAGTGRIVQHRDKVLVEGVNRRPPRSGHPPARDGEQEQGRRDPIDQRTWHVCRDDGQPRSSLVW